MEMRESIFDEEWFDEKSNTIELHKLRTATAPEEVIENRQVKGIIDQVPTAPLREITQTELKKLQKIIKTDLEWSVMLLHKGFDRVAVDKNGEIAEQPTYEQIGQALGVDKDEIKKTVDRVMNRAKRLKNNSPSRKCRISPKYRGNSDVHIVKRRDL